MTGPVPSNQNTTAKMTDGKESDKKNKGTAINNTGAENPGMHGTKAPQDPRTSHDHSHRFRKFCHRHCILPGHHHEGSDKAVTISTINVTDTTLPGKENTNASIATSSTSKGSENAEKLSPKVIPKVRPRVNSKASTKTAKRKPSANPRPMKIVVVIVMKIFIMMMRKIIIMMLMNAMNATRTDSTNVQSERKLAIVEKHLQMFAVEMNCTACGVGPVLSGGNKACRKT
ncbi:hypothetical protein HYALB_00004229 [Hymenoscyphus albidus]|uniref:Uncharacterized protein n=1 Tax=Hymenoscyphus albidus TaxID=595503 RepID=A0A9N9M6X8_9HELO|nr:hypothetical protein HYALB_00004229 [Hymenoscyphus albidus]